jgi:hypothetical protein
MNLDDRLEALRRSLELRAQMHAGAEHRQSAAEERHDREMEDIRREGRAFRSDLRRAFAMGVKRATSGSAVRSWTRRLPSSPRRNWSPKKSCRICPAQ